MKRLSAQVQMYIALGVVVVLSLVVVLLAIMPLFQKASQLDQQIVAEEKNLQTAKALLERRQAAKAQSAANEVELMRIANQLPDSPQLPGVIIELQDAANACKVTLSQIQVGDVKPAAALPDGSVPAYSSLTITMNMTGTWADVIAFCRKLNAADRGVRLLQSTFAYLPPGEGETKTQVSMGASVQVYMMAPAATDKMPTATSTQ